MCVVTLRINKRTGELMDCFGVGSLDQVRSNAWTTKIVQACIEHKYESDCVCCSGYRVAGNYKMRGESVREKV